MLAVAAKVSAPIPAAPADRYPVPGGLRDPEPTIPRRAVLWSLVLHLTITLGGIVGIWASNKDDLVATPRSFDATIVSLSALESQLPQGVPQPRQPEIPAPQKPLTSPRPRVLEKPAKAVSAAKDLSKQKTTNSKELSDSRAIPSNSSAPIGDPTSSSSEPARLSYQDMVATRLAQSKRYPERALRKNVNGDGAIRIQISSNGDVSHFEIVQSTSSTILDEELKDMVERASPFPPFPPDMRRDTLAVIVPVSFRLERSL
jgi:TonB family protein